MTLYGIGEPPPSEYQRVTQAFKIELFRQWQTYRNGVHLGQAAFDAIDYGRMTSAFLAAWEPLERHHVPNSAQFSAVADALKAELSRQCQDVVHMEPDVFGSIDFVAMASAAFGAVEGWSPAPAPDGSEWKAIPG